MTGLRKAIQMAGSQTELAKILGIGKSNVSKWVTFGRVPAAQAIQIEQVFGIPARSLIGKISARRGS